jgi:putative membrane protein
MRTTFIEALQYQQGNAEMPKYHTYQLPIAFALTCLGAVGCYDSDVPPPTTNDNEPATGMVRSAVLSDAERQILQTIHEKNLEEIAIGRMAKEKGASEAARVYGDHLVKDHSKNEEDLKALTQELGILLAELPQQSAAARTLEPLRGAEFDARFATMMSEGHSSLVQKVEAAQSEVRNEQVKSFLAKTLPVLRQHLQMAQEQARPGGHGSGSGAHNPENPPGGG